MLTHVLLATHVLLHDGVHRLVYIAHAPPKGPVGTRELLIKTFPVRRGHVVGGLGPEPVAGQPVGQEEADVPHHLARLRVDGLEVPLVGPVVQ